MQINNLDIALADQFYLNHIRCILIGLSRVGKTSFLNSLIGQDLFPSRPNALSDTVRAQGAVFGLENYEYLFVDTPSKIFF